MKILAQLLIVLLLTGCGSSVLGEIEFFGYKGFNQDAIRAAFPFREGDKFPPPGMKSSDQLKQIINDRVKQTIGQEPTDVSFVCCDSQQRFMVYIGLPGESNRPVVFNPVPTGDIRFPATIVKLREEFDNAWTEAVLKGKSTEDDSQGYTLTDYPAARNKELAIREYAMSNEELILQVLTSSSDARHRQIAAHALGYGRQSNEQIDALVKASFDIDKEVRNDAIRALEVLAGAKPDLAQRIPVKPFIQLLRSGAWSDHNKAVLLLGSLTRPRDPGVLQELRAEALDTLVEMATWRSSGHAYEARVLLGRIAGIEEKRLNELVEAGNIDAILAALKPAQ